MPTSREEWLLLVSLVSGSLALSFNVLLGIIILTVKCVYIGRYKWLLFFYTCSSAMYGACQIIAPGEFLLVHDGYMYYDTRRILPIWAGITVLLTFVSLYVVNIIILTLSFTYRYLAVCKYEKLAFFDRHWLAIALGSTAIVSLQMSLIIYTLMPSTFTRTFFEQDFYNSTGLEIEKVAYIGISVLYNGKYNREVAGMIAVFLLLGCGAGYIMITLSFKIWKGLHNHALQSITVAQNQKRIFCLLIFQLSLPLLFQVVPLQIIIASAYLHIPSEGIVRYFGCMLSFAQIIDPLLMLYFIRPYQKALFDRLPFCCQEKSTVACSSHTTTNPEAIRHFVANR